MMTVEQYQVYQITNAFVGRAWKDLSKWDKYLLGEWRADEKKCFETNDEMWLYNDLYQLKVWGYWGGDYYYPLLDSVMKKITKKEQREALRRY